MKYSYILFLLLFFTTTINARSPAPADAKLYFITPENGETVENPVIIKFGLVNMGIAPAGVDKENTGHHHLLIDTTVPATDKPIPNDEQHRHFGKGQTETAIVLPPGKHTLQLILGDFGHIPHDPVVISEKITITVK